MFGYFQKKESGLFNLPNSYNELIILSKKAAKLKSADIVMLRGADEPAYPTIIPLLVLNKQLKPHLDPQLNSETCHGKDIISTFKNIYQNVSKVSLNQNEHSVITEQAATLAMGIILLHPFRDGNFRSAICSIQCSLLRVGYTLTIRPIHLDAFIRGIAENMGNNYIMEPVSIESLKLFLLGKIKPVNLEYREKRWEEYITEGLQLSELRKEYEAYFPKGQAFHQLIGLTEELRKSVKRDKSLTDNIRLYKFYKTKGREASKSRSTADDLIKTIKDSTFPHNEPIVDIVLEYMDLYRPGRR
jgi:prophage maintenance system killer protein